MPSDVNQNLAHEHPLVVSFGRLVQEHLLVAKLGRLVLECLFVAYLDRLVHERPIMTKCGRLVTEDPQATDLQFWADQSWSTLYWLVWVDWSGSGPRRLFRNINLGANLGLSMWCSLVANLGRSPWKRPMVPVWTYPSESAPPHGQLWNYSGSFPSIRFG